jgi:hypothetical protein
VGGLECRSPPTDERIEIERLAVHASSLTVGARRRHQRQDRQRMW